MQKMKYLGLIIAFCLLVTACNSLAPTNPPEPDSDLAEPTAQEETALQVPVPVEQEKPEPEPAYIQVNAQTEIDHASLHGLPLNHTIVNTRDYIIVIKEDNSLWGAATGPLFVSGYVQLGEFFRIWDNAVAVAWGFPHFERPDLYGGNLYVLQTDGRLLAFENGGWRRSAPNSAQLIPPGINFDEEPVVILEDVRSIVTSGLFTYAVTNNNRLWTWGENGWGQLGDGTTVNRSTPTPVMDNVLSAGIGMHRGWAVATDGGFYVWGWNNGSHYMFLDTDVEWGGSLIQEDFLTAPTRIMENVIGASQTSDWIDGTFVIKEDNTLWAWGNNSHGQLGVPFQDRVFSPVKIMDNVAAVWGSVFNSTAVTLDGSVYSWGLNDRGQLGELEIVMIPSPERSRNDRVVGVSDFAFALNTQGRLYYLGHRMVGAGEVREPVFLVDGVMLPVHISSR